MRIGLLIGVAVLLPACGPRAEAPAADAGEAIGADGVRVAPAADADIEVLPLPPIGIAAPPAEG